MAANADLPAQPEQRALGVVGGDADLEGAGIEADRLHAREVLLHLHGDAVELDDQHGVRALGIAGADARLGGLDRQPVHHLDRGREDARADDRRHGDAGRVGRVEGGE